MTRSLLKGPFCELSFRKTILDKTKQKKLTRAQLGVNSKIKIWSRRSVILPICLNKEFLIYNGKTFIPLKISEEMVGHKFGEFASTRKKPIHKKKRK